MPILMALFGFPIVCTFWHMCSMFSEGHGSLPRIHHHFPWDWHRIHCWKHGPRQQQDSAFATPPMMVAGFLTLLVAATAVTLEESAKLFGLCTHTDWLSEALVAV